MADTGLQCDIALVQPEGPKTMPLKTARLGVLICALIALPMCARAQTGGAATHPSQTQKESNVVVFSGTATTAHIADPNEKVVFSGHVMRMADFVAAVSASIVTAQRPRNPEKQSREKDPPAPPSRP